jgi:contact-dependent growth inhibition (CDI) system CdiI-like immunity protein
MSSTERVPFTQWADDHRTERLFSIEPLSGYRTAYREDEGHVIYLPPDASDDALGQALLEALDRSRFIWPGDEPDFFKPERYRQRYRSWQRDFMRRYAYRNKHEAYKNMDWCRAKRSEGRISIARRMRDRPEYFRNLPVDRTIAIPETWDGATAGAVLRLALDRCE